MSRTVRVAALLTLVAATGCGVPLDPPPSGDPGGGGPPRAGGILRLASPEDPAVLDPAKGYDVTSWTFEQMLFNTLVDYDSGTTIVPEIAARWQASRDGRSFTFWLRPDVRFSSGRPCAATDVKYSIERLLQPSLHSQGAEFFQVIDGVADYVAGKATGIRGIKTPTSSQVVFHLTEIDPLFLHKLAMPFASIVDREAVERDGDDAFAQHPVGTGAFVVQEYIYGQRLLLARNPHYFRTGLPYLDGVELIIGPSEQLSWFKYQAGELDVSGIPSAEYARVTTDPRYRPLLLQRATLRTQYLGLNCGLAPFDQVAVRRAVNRAINKVRLIEIVDGRGVVAQTILPPDMPGYDPTTPGYAFDPNRARSELAAAGYAHGFDATLWVMRDDTGLRLAQSIQEDLRAIDVRLTIKTVEFSALIEAVRHPHQVPIFLMGWEADFPDPSNFLSVLLHTRSWGANNNTFCGTADTDARLDAAEPVLEPRRRRELFHAAEVQLMDEAPWVPLYHPLGASVRHPRVRDLELHPLRPTRVEQTWLAW